MSEINRDEVTWLSSMLYFDPHNYFEKTILLSPSSSTPLAANVFFSAQEEQNTRLTKIEERLAKLEGEI